MQCGVVIFLCRWKAGRGLRSIFTNSHLLFENNKRLANNNNFTWLQQFVIQYEFRIPQNTEQWLEKTALLLMIHAALDPHMISNALNDNSEFPFHLKGHSSKLVSLAHNVLLPDLFLVSGNLGILNRTQFTVEDCSHPSFHA